ncbi:hypothetical protein SAMN05216188_102382 [Lentzea xinjiangensis]|uniref:Secreted protein n=1 Tax=Lentzea xinjiangensis TaxID=402600 RepID=A0A1H9E3H1_9PSEU|nr:hypothetical protein [Lentzea xinjiangensis]SEQ20135.1 hypothetical protein SAMN05216188_102382 [Lentzea xinjiangensis]
MRTAVAALLLVAVTSGGAVASAAAPAARCAAARPVVSGTETAVQARVLTGCTAGELVVFQATLVARAHGTSCTAVSAEVDADPAAVPQWTRARLELACAPGDESRLGSEVTVEMHGAHDAHATSYSRGDSFAERNPAARHLWTVEFVAGLGELPEPAGPAAVGPSSGSAGEGRSWTRSDHQVYDG